MVLGFVVMFASYFSFSFIAKSQKVKKQKGAKDDSISEAVLTLPILNTTFDLLASRTQFLSFFKLNFYSIIKSNLFKILFIICGVLLTVTLWRGFEYFGLKSYPVTYKMMESVNGIAAFFVLLILVFFSGELVWRDRDCHINEVIDATPHTSVVSLLAKTLSLIGVGTILPYVILSMF